MTTDHHIDALLAQLRHHAMLSYIADRTGDRLPALKVGIPPHTGNEDPVPRLPATIPPPTPELLRLTRGMLHGRKIKPTEQEVHRVAELLNKVSWTPSRAGERVRYVDWEVALEPHRREELQQKGLI